MGSTSAWLHSWCAALEARTHANRQDAAASHEAIECAEGAMEQVRPDQRRPGIDFFTGSRLAAYRGRCHLWLSEPDAAQPLLEALASEDQTHVRVRSLLLLDLASTYIQQKEIEQACTVAGQAIALPVEHRIPALVKRAQRLQATLDPWRTHTAVKNLDEQIVGFGQQ